MRIDWWTLAFQTINALVLIWLLSHFLFRPVAQMVAARRQAAADLMTQAGAAKQAALHQQELATAEVTALAAQREQSYAALAAEMAAARSNLLEQAHAEVDALRLAANQEAEATRQRDVRAAAQRSVALAVALTEKLLARLPAEARVGGFVDGLCGALADMPSEVRQALGTEQAPLTVMTADPLSAEQAAQYGGHLERALGHTLCLDWQVDPTILAGLECRAEHTLIRNSFRHDLDNLKSELLRDDSTAT